MLPESQARILRLLARYPEEMESAWDVPRELSLPGLAESLGLVRSALHEPLKALEDAKLIHTRTAHVIDGGSRKRNVIHLTAKGRQQATTIIATVGEMTTNVEGDGGLHGRANELLSLSEALENGFAVVTGMPGIGKTALLQGLGNTRFCTLDASMDATALVGSWLASDDPPRDIDAQLALLANLGDSILVADEVQAVHERHREGIDALFARLMTPDGPKLAIGIRAPSPYEATVRLEGIPVEDGQLLLGDSVSEERALEVTEALDGHPLALHLWTPSDELPEASDAVQSFVEETVLSRLSDSERSDLDSLSCEPRPVDATHLDALDIDSLDDAALLRWPAGHVEVQHLIRNVRRVAWSNSEEIHAAAAQRWSAIESHDARWFEAHHMTMAGLDSSDFIEEHSAAIASTGSAATSVLIEDALQALPDAHGLRRMAAQIALDRGEAKHAEAHLNELPEPDHALLARLHRINGDLSAAAEADAAALSTASPAMASQMQLSRLAVMLDDRLPDEVSNLSPIEQGLSKVNIGTLDADKRRSAVVLLAVLRHRVAVLKKEAENALKIRNDLAELAGGQDPLVERLEHLADLFLAEPDGAEALAAESAMRRLVERTSDPIQRVSLGLALVQAQSRTNSPGAATTLERLQEVPLPLDLAAGRRLDAMRWYWRGKLESNSRIAYWREAALRLRSAECPHAARELMTRLHRAL